jgi:translation initiation factor 1
MKNKQTTGGLSGLANLGGLVYSTDAGRMCPDCRQPVANCICKAQAQAQHLSKTDGVVRVSLQTKGRGGKSVTLVKGLPLDAGGLAALAKQLRNACGTGGTVKDGVVEVQGDHVATVMVALQKQSYVVKRAGG